MSFFNKKTDVLLSSKECNTLYNEFINNRLPRNKMGQASELIFLLLYLGSSKSSFTSSNLLTIDAGEGNIYWLKV